MTDDQRRHNARSEQQIEQTIAFLGDWLPRSWRAMYMGCIEQGFTSIQAFVLVQTYIVSQCPNGVRAPEGQSNNKDENTQE